MKLLKNISQSPLFEKVVLASSDQALLSGLGFLISIILIKTVSKTEYGYYSITMPILLFFVSIQNAIVNTPLTVLLSEKKDDERKTYLASLCYGQFMIILPAVFVGLLFALLLTCFGFDSIKTSLIAVLSFSAIGILYREFLRSCFYAEGTPLKVLKLDICYIVLMLVFIAFQYFVLIINVNWIYINMCVSGLLISLFFYRNRGWNVEKKSIKESYQENWKLGKWALFGVFVTHIQNYCYIYLLGALLNTVAVADVSAARLLVMPLVMLRIGWSKIAIPHGSKLRELGQIKKFYREQLYMSLFLVSGVVMYVMVLLLFSEELQQLILSEKYGSAFKYVKFWGVISSLGSLIMNAMNGLLVMKNFRIVSKVNLITMLITIGSTYFMIKAYGTEGALFAMIIGESLLAIGLWYYFSKIVFFSSLDQPPVLAKTYGE